VLNNKVDKFTYLVFQACHSEANSSVNLCNLLTVLPGWSLEMNQMMIYRDKRGCWDYYRAFCSL